LHPINQSPPFPLFNNIKNHLGFGFGFALHPINQSPPFPLFNNIKNHLGFGFGFGTGFVVPPIISHLLINIY